MLKGLLKALRLLNLVLVISSRLLLFIGWNDPGVNETLTRINSANAYMMRDLISVGIYEHPKVLELAFKDIGKLLTAVYLFYQKWPVGTALTIHLGCIPKNISRQPVQFTAGGIFFADPAFGVYPASQNIQTQPSLPPFQFFGQGTPSNISNIAANLYCDPLPELSDWELTGQAKGDGTFEGRLKYKNCFLDIRGDMAHPDSFLGIGVTDASLGVEFEVGRLLGQLFGSNN